MEMTVISEFKKGEIKFKNPALTKSTDKLLKNMGKSKEAFCAAANELKRIRDEKLFEDDFTDENGKPNFSRYCEEILGISKSKASRIIITGSRLLSPEIVTKERPEYFANFGDTKLAIIAGIGDSYEECVDFCVEYGIDETTDQKEIREHLKEYKNRKKQSKEIDANGETVDNENNKSTETTESKALLTDKQIKQLVGEMFRRDLNALIQKYPDFEECITSAAEKW